MDSQGRRRLSSAHVISLLSLFVAMSGWAYAATVQKNSVNSASVKNSSLKGKDVKDESLTTADVDESTLEGIQGPAGAQGPQGLQGPPGPATGPAGGVLTGTYPNPGLGPNVVGSTNLAANLADVLDANDLAPQGVDDSELSDDLANTVDANDIAPDAIGDSELGAGAAGADELDTITLNTATGPVPGGGTAQNGNMDTVGMTARCDPGEIVIAGGAHWSPAAANNEELYIVESQPLPPIDWFARGGNDTGDERTLIVTAVCLSS